MNRNISIEFQEDISKKAMKRLEYSKRITILILIVLIINYSLIAIPTNAYIKKDNIKRRGTALASSNVVEKLFDNIHSALDGIFHRDYINAVNKIESESKTSDISHEEFAKRLNEILNNKKRIDIGENFVNEIINDNDRMEYYDLYIKLAKEKGYIVTSYIDYLNQYMHTDKKVLILRHDIDEKSDGTKMMFDIEKKNDVKATYYFRWKTFDKDLIKEIASAGFEVGLHYETIANYCMDHHTRTITHEDIDKCREILKNEIKEFKEKSGIDIQTISSHGNPINREINMPNNILLIGQKYSDYGIVSETYDPEILKMYINSYICDNDLMKKYGFSYRANPIDSIVGNDKVIEFLSHPSHWYYTIDERAKMYLEVQNSNKKSRV